MDLACRWYAKYVDAACSTCLSDSGGMSCHAPTSRSGLPYGSGFRSTRLTTVKIATVAATPMTRVKIAVTVKTGVRPSDLQAWRRSAIGMSGSTQPAVHRFRSTLPNVKLSHDQSSRWRRRDDPLLVRQRCVAEGTRDRAGRGDRRPPRHRRGAHGDRPRAGVLRGARRRPGPWRLLHAMDHALRRPRVRAPCGYRGVSLRRES